MLLGLDSQTQLVETALMSRRPVIDHLIGRTIRLRRNLRFEPALHPFCALLVLDLPHYDVRLFGDPFLGHHDTPLDGVQVGHLEGLLLVAVIVFRDWNLNVSIHNLAFLDHS